MSTNCLTKFVCLRISITWLYGFWIRVLILRNPPAWRRCVYVISTVCIFLFVNGLSLNLWQECRFLVTSSIFDMISSIFAKYRITLTSNVHFRAWIALQCTRIHAGSSGFWGSYAPAADGVAPPHCWQILAPPLVSRMAQKQFLPFLDPRASRALGGPWTHTWWTALI